LESAIGNSQIKLLIPAGDVPDPEVSIVIPALNEELTIGEFVEPMSEARSSSSTAQAMPPRKSRSPEGLAC
jgi:hypothetical protein